MAEKIVKKVKIEVDDKGSLKRTGKDAQTLNRNMKGLSKQSSNASKNFSKTAQGMQGVLVPAYAEVAARVFALTAVYQALNRAADFRILMQGQAEYAKKTGKNMADIAKQVQRASKGMLNFADASSQVALATTSGITSSQVVKMTKAAVDSSTALGRSVQDTMDRLTRGIVKAEPEILDEIGVIIRLDKVYKDYAESVSKSTAELTEGEKATARYTAIMGQLESKFGGIADKVDPNYMRAAAASVMDILAQSSTKLVALVNPILKFLSEAKNAIVVILLVIMKNIVGKVFPMFKTMGASIAAYPAKMAANVNLLSGQIDIMNGKIAKNKMITKDFNTAINKSMPAQYRGAAWKTAGPGVGGQKTKLRSMGATISRAEKQMGTGAAITSGKYTGMTRAQLNVMKVEHKALQKEIGKTHTINQRFAAEGSLAITKFNKTVAQTKMFFATAAASATQYFTITKQLIVDHGLLKGTWMGLQAIGLEWVEAAGGATLYERALKRVAATTGALGVMTAFLGKIISKAFGWLVALTMIVSIGKMILDIFGVFDTRFGKAAKAAKTLSEEIREQKSLFDDKDPKISFEGAAESFDEAMANITFADNFATSLYESTSKAMKVLSRDMQEIGFWDSLMDGLKSIFGRGIIDNMAASAVGTADMLAKAYPDIAKQMRDKYQVSGKVLGSGEKYKKALSDYMSKQSLMGMDIRDAEKFSKTDIGKEFIRPKTMADKIREIEENDQLDKYEKQVELSQITGDYLDKLEKQQKAERARVEDTKAMTDALENLGKAHKKFGTSLLTKSGVHDMAVEWKKIDAILNADNLLKSTKFLQLRDAGHLDDKGPMGVQAPWMKGNAKDAAFDYIMEQGGMDFLMENWAELDKKLMKATTRRLKQERELKELKIFGNSALEEQTQKQKLIAELNLVEKRESLRLLELEYKKELATDHDIDQARTKLAIAEKEVEDVGKIALKQAEDRAKLEGRTLTIMEKLAALKKDWGDSPFWGEWKKDEATSFFTKYIQNLDKSIQKQNKLNLLLANFRHLSSGEQSQINQALDKSLQFSSWSGMGNMEWKDTILNDSILKGIGEKEYKRNRTAELISENPILKMHKPVIDLYFRVEELRAKNLNKDLLLQAEKMMIETEYKLALEDKLDARWKERTEMWAQAMKTIADGFGSAVSSAFNDIFMNKGFDMKKFRTDLAQAFASASSNIIGNMMQKQVFGRTGLVSNMLKGMGMDSKWLDALFPKTELELAEERTRLLQLMLIELEELNEKRKITGTVYPGDPNNVVPGGLASLEALANSGSRLKKENTYGYDESGFIGEGGIGPIKADAGFGYGGKPSSLNGSGEFKTHDKGVYALLNRYLFDWEGTYKVREEDMWATPRVTPRASSFTGPNPYDANHWSNTSGPGSITRSMNHAEAIRMNELNEKRNTLAKETLIATQSIELNTGENGTLGGFMNSLGTTAGEGAKSLFGVITDTIGGGFGSKSIFGKGPNNSFSSQSSFGSQMLGAIISSFLPFGSGGIAPGGFRAFANGGIANKPTLGMVGEGKYNEAVVPLPDGKSIPIKGTGGNNNVTVNVSVDAQGQSSATESSGDGAKELGFMLSQAVQAELVEQQRPGGLLSSY